MEQLIASLCDLLHATSIHTRLYMKIQLLTQLQQALQVMESDDSSNRKQMVGRASPAAFSTMKKNHDIITNNIDDKNYYYDSPCLLLEWLCWKHFFEPPKVNTIICKNTTSLRYWRNAVEEEYVLFLLLGRLLHLYKKHMQTESEKNGLFY